MMLRASFSLWLAMAALAATAGPAAAAGLACPGTLAIQPQEQVQAPAGWQAASEPQNHYLRGARLFDGDPKDLADLIGERGGWDLLPNEGRGYTLICQYEGTEATLQARVPEGLRRCTVSRRKANWRGVRFGREVTDGTETVVRCQ
ncbi:MAG: hypothetical protein ABS99_04670 [Acetobacteraceae bacterium SCN 69-10]|nr:hypothetical protein [Rhodospirillales bacterium]ODU57838.1 MAG: hypothetical protein ABS99_04670 [Acetobacteraceae bacterium SCN 69-10]OJY70390.1 MAG: hypothetical protein BGP12_21870 [Rhodospirillales bacterium 70-18]